MTILPFFISSIADSMLATDMGNLSVQGQGASKIKGYEPAFDPYFSLTLLK
jgi:hypothetical protein